MSLGKLFVVSAPSGAGKTTLVQAILDTLGKQCHLKRAITYTTRPPREGEIDGKHYHFISIDEFKEKIEQDAFLEWSTWYDHYYGSPASMLRGLQEGHSYIAILDRPGAKDVKQSFPATVLIWIVPPSLEVLKDRLLKRGDDLHVVENRLKKAAIEIEQEQNEQFYDYHIINDDFNLAVGQLQRAVMKELKNCAGCCCE